MTAAEYLIKHRHDETEKALRAAQADSLITRVLSRLPPDLAIERLWAAGYCAHARLTLPPVLTMAQNALENLDLLPAEPLARVKDGSLTFKPLAEVTPQERERGDVTEIAPVILTHEVAPFYPMGAKRELKWWTTVSDLAVEVVVPLLDHTASTVTINTSGFGRTRKHQSTIATCPGAHADRFWVSDKVTTAHVVFFWDAPRAEEGS